MILWQFPHAANGAFKKDYDNIIWRNNEKEFEAWKNGETGYPIVDAGMRELNETGFMHNRVRMIVASFLVKHLLIDWRWGESYFAEKLLDFIDKTGSTNCIDTLQQKSSNELNIYYCSPHLVYSKCFRHNVSEPIDTDIQNNNKSLTLPFETKVQDELNFYKNNNLIIERVDFENIINVLLKEPTEEFFIYTCAKNWWKQYSIIIRKIFR